jgi:hypothetical protein
MAKGECGSTSPENFYHRDAWGRVLAIRPDLAPALPAQPRLRGVDARMARKMDDPYAREDMRNMRIAARAEEVQRPIGGSGCFRAASALFSPLRKYAPNSHLGGSSQESGEVSKGGVRDVWSNEWAARSPQGRGRDAQHRREHPDAMRVVPSQVALENDPSFRADRLRACGNGVVPEQAAHAWRGLWRALFGG